MDHDFAHTTTSLVFPWLLRWDQMHGSDDGDRIIQAEIRIITMIITHCDLTVVPVTNIIHERTCKE